MEGNMILQRINTQCVDNREPIRYNKGELIKALTNSLANGINRPVKATEIANVIKGIFRIEYQEKGHYKEVKTSTLVTEVRKALKA